MLDTILNTLDTYRDDVIDLQKNLVAIPALGPDNDDPGCLAEVPKTNYLHDYLTQLGYNDIIEVNAPDDRVAGGVRPNIIALRPGKSKQTLWVISHTDIVPPGDLGLWESDPYELRVEGDAIYGRGVEDDHQGIVSSVLVAKVLAEQNVTPELSYGVILVSDEETGSAYGLDHVVKTRPDLFSKDDLFLVPDFGTPDSTLIEVSEKSMLWIKVNVKGKQCHASTPNQGINSLRAAAAFILKANSLYETFDKTDELFKPSCSTFEPTKKDANVPNVNTIPGLDVFYIDCRVLPEYNLDDVLTEVERLGHEVENEYKVKISYEIMQREDAAPPTPVESDVVQKLMRGIKAIYKTDGLPQGIGGGTVAAFLRTQGYEAAVWATCVHNAHQPNENSLISTQIGDAKVIAHMLMK